MAKSLFPMPFSTMKNHRSLKSYMVAGMKRGNRVQDKLRLSVSESKDMFKSILEPDRRGSH